MHWKTARKGSIGMNYHVSTHPINPDPIDEKNRRQARNSINNNNRVEKKGIGGGSERERKRERNRIHDANQLQMSLAVSFVCHPKKTANIEHKSTLNWTCAAHNTFHSHKFSRTVTCTSDIRREWTFFCVNSIFPASFFTFGFFGSKFCVTGSMK